MNTATSTVKRGEVYYIQPFSTTGSEQRSGRPAVIVSNNLNNEHSNIFEICYLTLQDKNPLPTHVKIESGKCLNSTVLCEQITSISRDKLGDYMCRLSDSLMEQVDKALAVSVGIDIDYGYTSTIKSYVENDIKVTEDLSKSIIQDLRNENACLKKEAEYLRKELERWKEEYSAIEEEHKSCSMYEKMYNDILDRVMKRG